MYIFVIIPQLVVAFVTIDLSSAVVVGAIGVIMLLIACPRFSYFIAMAKSGSWNVCPRNCH